jgi:hypothetical protein
MTRTKRTDISLAKQGSGAGRQQQSNKKEISDNGLAYNTQFQDTRSSRRRRFPALAAPAFVRRGQ